VPAYHLGWRSERCGARHLAYLPFLSPQTPATLRPVRGFPAPPGRSWLRRLLRRLRDPRARAP